MPLDEATEYLVRRLSKPTDGNTDVAGDEPNATGETGASTDAPPRSAMGVPAHSLNVPPLSLVADSQAAASSPLSTLAPSADFDDDLELESEYQGKSRMRAQTEPPPDLGERFELLEFLGEGGMGAVYKIRERATQKTYAAKILKRELAQDPAAIKRFEQEVRAAGELTHPNLVFVYGSSRTADGAPYMVMNYVDGMGLNDLISRDKAIPANQALPIFMQVADALVHAHSKGIIHRDLKPSNILIFQHELQQNAVRVVDFGIAKMMPLGVKNTDSFTQTNELFGSPLYMSPEQCSGDRIDHRSDIYSLGCVMYKTLCGRPPFDDTNAMKTMIAHMQVEPTPLRLVNKTVDIPKTLEAVVMHCLKKNPDERYQSAADLKADLKAIQTGKSISRSTTIDRVRPSQINPQLKLVAAFLSGVVCTLAVMNLIPHTVNSTTVNQAPKQAESEAEARAYRAADLSTTIFPSLSESELYKHEQGKSATPQPKLTREKLQKTIRDCTHAISLNPAAASAYKLRMWAYEQLGSYDQAIDDCNVVLKLDSSDANAYLFRARALANLEEFKKAIDDCNDALKWHPSKIAALELRGWCHQKLGEFSLACKDYVSILELDENNVVATENLAMLYAELEKFELSKDMYSRAIKLSPFHSQMYDGRGWVHGKLKEYQEAIADFTTAIGMEPASAKAYANRGWNYAQLAQFSKAIADGKRAVSLDPNDAQAHIWLGKSYMQAGQQQDAIKEFSQCLLLSPRNRNALEERAQAYEDLGKNELAAQDRLEAKKTRAYTQQIQ